MEWKRVYLLAQLDNGTFALDRVIARREKAQAKVHCSSTQPGCLNYKQLTSNRLSIDFIIIRRNSNIIIGIQISI